MIGIILQLPETYLWMEMDLNGKFMVNSCQMQIKDKSDDLRCILGFISIKMFCLSVKSTLTTQDEC